MGVFVLLQGRGASDHQAEAEAPAAEEARRSWAREELSVVVDVGDDPLVTRTACTREQPTRDLSRAISRGDVHPRDSVVVHGNARTPGASPPSLSLWGRSGAVRGKSPVDLEQIYGFTDFDRTSPDHRGAVTQNSESTQGR